MKKSLFLPIFAISGFALAVWANEIPAADSVDQPSRGEPAAIVCMEKEQGRIAARLGMSAPMELEAFAGRDPVQDVINTGTVIEVTLEQVEQALAAAAATPDPEDDKSALDLKHRGSYRFYAPDAGSR